MIEKYESFSNSYVVSNGNDAVIIDAGLSSDLATIIKNKYNIKAILLTHGQYDHIEGLKYFKDVDIYIHKDEEEFLYDSNLNLYYFMNSNSYNKGELKIHTVNDNDVIKLIGYVFLVIHTPGHTAGGISIKCDNMLFSGDTLFKRGIGRTDLETGNMDDLYNSLSSKLYKLDDCVVVYPGHGESTTIGDEKRNSQ